MMDLLAWLIAGFMLFLALCAALHGSHGALIFSIALLLRASLVAVAAGGHPLPGNHLDAELFEECAEVWSRDGTATLWKNVETGRLGYGYLLSILYAFLGPCKTLALLLNSLLGAATCALVWIAARELTTPSRARWAAWFNVFFPTSVLYSALLLRESFTTFFLVLSLSGFVFFWTRGRPSALLLGVAALLGCIFFHTGFLVLIPVLAFTGLWHLLTLRGSGGLPRLAGALGGIVAITAVCLLVYFTGFGAEKVGGDLESLASIDRIAAKQQATDSMTRAGYLPDLQPRSPADLLWQTPLRIFYFLFAPLPWMITSAEDLLGLLVSALTLLAVIMMLWHTPCWPRHPALCYLAMILAALTTVFALGTSNYGTAIRHKTKFVPLVCLLAVGVPRPTTPRPARVTSHALSP